MFSIKKCVISYRHIFAVQLYNFYLNVRVFFEKNFTRECCNINWMKTFRKSKKIVSLQTFVIGMKKLIKAIAIAIINIMMLNSVLAADSVLNSGVWYKMSVGSTGM